MLPVSLPPLQFQVPGVATPTFIRPAHHDETFFRPESPDISRQSVLPDFPSADSAHEDRAWSKWADWHLAVALLPQRDTTQGESYKLADIAPCVGTISLSQFSRWAQKVYPRWEGRYAFKLLHVLPIIKRCQQDADKRYSREQLLEKVREKYFSAN